MIIFLFQVSLTPSKLPKEITFINVPTRVNQVNHVANKAKTTVYSMLKIARRRVGHAVRKVITSMNWKKLFKRKKLKSKKSAKKSSILKNSKEGSLDIDFDDRNREMTTLRKHFLDIGIDAEKSGEMVDLIAKYKYLLIAGLKPTQNYEDIFLRFKSTRSKEEAQEVYANFIGTTLTLENNAFKSMIYEFMYYNRVDSDTLKKVQEEFPHIKFPENLAASSNKVDNLRMESLPDLRRMA